MTHSLRRRAGLVAALAMLAGCGPAVPAHSPAAHSATVPPTRLPALSPAPPGVDPHHWEAEQLAAHDIAAYSPPAGAVHVSAAPSGSVLTTSPIRPGTPDLVDLSEFWRTGGSMTSVIAWATHHGPAGAATAGGGQTGLRGTVTSMAVQFSLPTASGLDSRQLLVSVAPDGSGAVLMRIDSQVVWDPARPAWSLVPAADTQVTVTVWTGAGGTDPHTVRSSSAATVAQLRSLVNAADETSGGAYSCPMETGQNVSIRFGGAGEPTVSVGGEVDECGGLGLTVAGHPHLQIEDPGTRILERAEALTHTTAAIAAAG